MIKVKIRNFSKWNWRGGGFQIQSFIRIFHKSCSDKIGVNWGIEEWLYE